MKTIKEKWFFFPTVQTVNERLRLGERQDMDVLQLRFHTEWLEDDCQVVDQIRWSSYLVLRGNWVTRDAFLAQRAV